MTAADRSPLRPVADAFAAAGIEAFADTRRELDAATALEREHVDRQRAVRDAEAELVDRLADGASLDEVVTELAAVHAPGLAEVVDRAVTARRRRAARTAAGEALEAHRSLRPLVADAVSDAVAAGRRVVDVDRVAKAVRSSEYRMKVPPAVAGCDEHPDWSAAVDASRRVQALQRLANLLPSVDGPTSSLWAARHAGEAGAVAELVPSPLHVAVGDALNWQPGLRMVDPAGGSLRDDGGRDARRAAVAAATKLAPLRRAVDRVTGAA